MSLPPPASPYPPPDDDGFITVADAAVLLKVSQKTVRRRIADGTLPASAVEPRPLLRLRRDDVLRLAQPRLRASKKLSTGGS